MRIVATLTFALLLPAVIGCTPPDADATTATQLPEKIDPASRVHCSEASDEKAIEIAQSVMEAMGGWDSWDRTRFLRWKFFGGREHHWDIHTGDIRIEGSMGRGDAAKQMLFLMNVNDGTGRVWQDGEELSGDALTEALASGKSIWINDSYWMVMPYKLLDPGVTLTYVGERAMEDGRMADVLGLTFDGVGDTPENRYDVFVARDTGLVEAWAFYPTRETEEPQFTMPWQNWTRFGEILLSTGRGRDRDWAIQVYDELPAAVFSDPAAVEG